MIAALIFEDARGNTHHFQVELLEHNAPINEAAAAVRLRESKALKRPCILQVLVQEATIVESSTKVPA